MLNKLLIALFICMSLGQIGSLSKSDGFNIYIFDIAVFAFSSIGIFYFLINKKLVIPKVALFFGAFIVFALFSLINAFTQYSFTNQLASVFYLVRLFFYITAGVVVYNMVLTKKITKDLLLNIILYSGVILVFSGIIQLIILPDISVLSPALGWDPHKNRMVSTLLDPNFLGCYIVICLLILINKFFSNVKKPVSPMDVSLLLIFGISLVLTFSRSSWLMFGMVIFIYGLIKNRLLLLLCILVAFMAYFAVPRIQTRLSGITDPADSASFRLISWNNAVKVFQNNPIIGVGFNTYRYTQIDYGFITSTDSTQNSAAGADSSLLLVLATTGIVGFALFACSFIFAIKEQKSVFVITLISALFIHSLFVNSVFYPQMMIIWSVLLIGCSKDSFSRKLL